MPRSQQIIPEYLHPHIMTVINDNTVFTDIVNHPEDPIRMAHVFVSSKGRDNVFIPFDTSTGFIEEYGTPNFKLHGQPIYNADIALKTGVVKSYCMRIMPADAKYANLVVLAKTKVTGTTDKKLEIKLVGQTITAVTDKVAFSTAVAALAATEPDTDGYSTYPLFGIYCLGRGIYGNNFRIRLISDTLADDDNGYKNYKIQILENDVTLKTKEAFSGCFDPDTKVDDASIYISDIINDIESGSNKIGIFTYDKGVNDLFELYKTVDTDTTMKLSTFDFFFGKNYDGTSNTNITISTATGAISLDAAEGITLASGAEGTFAFGAEGRDTAIAAAYVNAFNGTTDRIIKSKWRMPLDLIMDAGYDDTAKRALIALITSREDVYGYIDGGILNTITDALTWAETYKTLASTNFSKEMHHYYIKDPYSGKNIPVTITYFYSSALATHYKYNGRYIPFVGEDYAKLSGYIKGTFKPVVDADDLENKESLYKLRINYFESIAENTFIRGTQSTSQNVWSDLSEEHNMALLLQIKRKLEQYIVKKRYNFSEKEDRTRFTQDAKLLMGDFSTLVRSIDVYFDMNAFEETRSILHCYASIVFRTIVKRGITEIDINPRS